jgi:hypothetical protein
MLGTHFLNIGIIVASITICTAGAKKFQNGTDLKGKDHRGNNLKGADIS